MKLVLKYFLISATMLLVACEKNLLNEEYYKNVIYLKSDENNIYNYVHHMNDSVSRGFLTLGSGGSMPLSDDVIVNLEIDTTILSEYNHRNFGSEYNKYIRMVDSKLFVLPSYRIILKKGDLAATTFFPIEIDANELSPDTTYMIPFRITTTSAGEVNPEKSIVLYRPQLANLYTSPKSNRYRMKGTKQVEGSSAISNITTTKSITPLGRNRVRVFPENMASSTALQDILNKTIVLVINDDNTVLVKPFKNIKVEAVNESYYNPDLKVFNLSYRYKLPNSSTWTVLNEVLTKVE